MKLLFKNFVMLALLLLMHSNSFAQICRGKTVYLQLPLEGWSRTSINILWEGNIRTVTATLQGNYSVFTFPSLPNDDGYVNKMFFFSMKNGPDIDMNNRWIASGPRYDIATNARPSDAQGISCSNFTSSPVYIYPDPYNPTQTIVSIEPPNSYTLYLLPPATKMYIENGPYIMSMSTMAKTQMSVDPTRCGWYKYTWFNVPVPEQVIIGAGSSLHEPISGIIALADKFGDTPGDKFFIADDGPNGWYATDLGRQGVCSYNFAALIYDTDKSVNPSFTESADDIGCGSNVWSGNFGSGIVKGMVKPTLNAETRKIECNNCTTGCGTFKSVADFNNAFDPNSNTNVVLCYDMPFTRTANGLWEYDSDKMKNHSGQTVGGFFPEVLQSRVISGADYNQCQNCDRKYKAESFVNLASSINISCFERGLTTNASGGCGAAYGQGAFSHGDNPLDTWGATPSGSVSWSDTWRNQQINLWGGTNTGANATANQHFCFESHAEFTYEKGQEFFFRGDDDIWVYMNNQLVVDLGGVKLAAPGYVNLDSLGLVEGEKYPIDIFFCDRRTTMSNVRIATSMYMGQSTSDGVGLYLTEDYEVCLQEAANTCAALVSGGTDPICGAELAPRLSYKLIVPGWGEVPLNASNENCMEISERFLICYGGIVLNNGVARVNAPAITESYLVEHGFQLHAMVAGYQSFNISNAEPGKQPSSITKAPRIFKKQDPVYYSIKGEPLGKQKPKKAGVYIVRQNGTSKLIVEK
ncbi:MAG: fibro-slime domain-containing protein [Fibromonadales bacterium]|nr:fibro-slime domain-containing protein [Fibromonadales bacterium]